MLLATLGATGYFRVLPSCTGRRRKLTTIGDGASYGVLILDNVVCESDCLEYGMTE